MNALDVGRARGDVAEGQNREVLGKGSQELLLRMKGKDEVRLQKLEIEVGRVGRWEMVLERTAG